MAAPSHVLLAKSKENSIKAKWAFVSAKIVRSVGRPSSIGMMTPILKARENGDSLIGFL